MYREKVGPVPRGVREEAVGGFHERAFGDVRRESFAWICVTRGCHRQLKCRAMEKSQEGLLSKEQKKDPSAWTVPVTRRVRFTSRNRPHRRPRRSSVRTTARCRRSPCCALWPHGCRITDTHLHTHTPTNIAHLPREDLRYACASALPCVAAHAQCSCASQSICVEASCPFFCGAVVGAAFCESVGAASPAQERCLHQRAKASSREPESSEPCGACVHPKRMCQDEGVSPARPGRRLPAFPGPVQCSAHPGSSGVVRLRTWVRACPCRLSFKFLARTSQSHMLGVELT